MAPAGTDFVLGTPHPKTPEPDWTCGDVSVWRGHHEAAPCETVHSEESGVAAGSWPRG